jgi:hypothetical protein
VHGNPQVADVLLHLPWELVVRDFDNSAAAADITAFAEAVSSGQS